MTGYTASVNIMIVVVIVIVVVAFTLRSEIGLDSMFSVHVNTSQTSHCLEIRA
jgi:hypothetical protein